MQLKINNSEDAAKASKFINGLEARFIQKISVFTGYEGKQGLTGKLDIEIEFHSDNFADQNVPVEKIIKAKFYEVKDIKFDFQKFHCPADDNPESIWVMFDIEFRQERNNRFFLILKKPELVKWQPGEHALFSFLNAEIGGD